MLTVPAQKAQQLALDIAAPLSGMILLVALIFLFLLKEGLALFRTVSPGDFLGGHRWYPISDPAQFGILPLILGSCWVTAGAVVLSVPIGIASALFVSEVATGWIKDVLKTGIELLAAIPSVVLGFVGLAILAPAIKDVAPTLQKRSRSSTSA